MPRGAADARGEPGCRSIWCCSSSSRRCTSPATSPAPSSAHGSGCATRCIEPVLAAPAHDASRARCSGGGLVGGPSFVYRITDAGRAAGACCSSSRTTTSASRRCRSRQYERYMRAFDAQSPPQRRRASGSAQAFSHLVLSDRVLDQLGPAVNGGHSLFVYGPPGNGKTVIAQGDPEPARRRHRHPARDRGRRPHHPGLRPGRARGRGRSRPAERPRRRRAAAIGRWVRCRRPLVTVGGELTLELARAGLSARRRVLPGADAAGRQRRRAGHRRLRPAAVLAGRAAQPLDHAAREPRRLPDAADRAEAAGAVRRAGRVRHQHQAGGSRRRGVPAPHPLQGLRREPDGGRLQARSSSAAAPSASSTTTRRWSTGCCASDCSAAGIPLRGCHPRDLIDQALSLADYLGEPRRLTDDAAAGGLRQLLRRRPGVAAPRSPMAR